MKAKFICVFITLIFTSGCAKKIFYNIPEDTDYPKKSILFLETKGHPLSGTTSLILKSVNSIQTERKYSNSRVEFKPGIYEIEFEISGRPGIAQSFALGMTGGTAAMNPYMYGTNREKEAVNSHNIEFLPGYYYFASFIINDQNQPIITIEEF
jgi:hypothetical protein